MTNDETRSRKPDSPSTRATGALRNSDFRASFVIRHSSFVIQISVLGRLLPSGSCLAEETLGHLFVRAGDDVAGDQLADLAGRLAAGIDGRLYTGDVAAADDGDHAAADGDGFGNGDVGGLGHRVGGFHVAGVALG